MKRWTCAVAMFFLTQTGLALEAPLADLRSVDGAEKTAEWTEVLTGTLSVTAAGRAFVEPAYFLNVAEYKYLRAELSGPRCYSMFSSFGITHDARDRQYTFYYPDQEGVIELNEPGIAWILFETISRGAGRCDVRVLAALGNDDDDGDEGEFILAGVLAYAGGFEENLQIDLEVPLEVSQFKVAVPAFCQGLEIVTAGTVTEGIFDRARLVDAEELIFEVNGGQGRRIRSISVDLNGPRETACDIPVYVR